MSILAFLFAVLPFCLLGFFFPGCGCCGGASCFICSGEAAALTLWVEVVGVANDSCILCGDYNCAFPMAYWVSGTSNVGLEDDQAVHYCYWRFSYACKYACDTTGADPGFFGLGVVYNADTDETTISFGQSSIVAIRFTLVVPGKINCTDLCDMELPTDLPSDNCDITAATCFIRCSAPEGICPAGTEDCDPDEDDGDGNWVCINGEWVLLDNTCEEGFEPCRPPAEECDVDYETTTTDCVEIGTCPEPDPAGGTADWECNADNEWELTGETCTGDGSPCPPVTPCDENDVATTDCELPEECNEPPAGGGPCEWIWDSGNWTGPTGGCDAGYDCDPPPIVGGEVDNDLAYTPCYDDTEAPPGGCQGYACAWIGNVGGGWDRIDNSAVVCVAPCQCQPPARGALFGQLEFSDCFGSA